MARYGGNPTTGVDARRYCVQKCLSCYESAVMLDVVKVAGVEVWGYNRFSLLITALQ